MTDTATTITRESAFKQALSTIRKQGYRARYNVRGCCRSCIAYDWAGDPKQKDKVGVWHYGGQGGRLLFHDGEIYLADGWEKAWRRYSVKPVETIYFNHDGTEEQIRSFVQAFEQQGLQVTWDGSEYSCIQVGKLSQDSPA